MVSKERVCTNLDEESQNQQVNENENDVFDYTKRAQWVRAAVLGANDGLVSTASLMMRVGAVKHDVKVMILTGFAGLVVGACSMAIGEFVSVFSQLDIEVAQRRREQQNDEDKKEQYGEEDDKLPNPLQAALASALAFSVGAMVPLLGASFVKEYKVRVGVVVAAITVGLGVFGWLGAFLGGSPIVRATIRVLVDGWLAMAITFTLTKFIGSYGF